MIIHGDCLEEMRKMDADSVDLICTDPPYGYSFMGKDWDKAVPSVEIWKECLRVLKPGAFLFCMSAPRSDVQQAMVERLIQGGFRLDFTPIYWTYASGFPKALNVAGNIDKIVDRICKTLSVNIAEKLLSDTVAKYDQDTNIVVQSVDISPKQWTFNVRPAVKLCESLNVSTGVRLIVPSSAITQVCEQALSKIKGVEVSRIELGNVKSLSEQDINALSVELIESLKRTILSLFNTSPNSDTTSPTASVSATNVITMESTRECLTSSMADILVKRPRENSKQFKGSYGGLQVKPAVEVIIVAMKPLSEKTYVDQALANGHGVTWLDDVRIPFNSEFDKSNAVPFAPGSIKTFRGGVPKLDRENLKANVYTGQNQTGRFPANLLVSDDVLNDGITRTSGKGNTFIGQGGKRTDHYYGANTVQSVFGDSGSYSRYFDLDKWASTLPFLIVPKASKSEKNEGLGCTGLPVKRSGGMEARNRDSGKGQFEGETPMAKNHHPTVKPLKLMSYLITLGSRPGDVVLDPFCGSGTTIVAAKKLQRKGIGIEREADYVEIARARLDADKQERLF